MLFLDKFVMWSAWHFVYIASPFVLMLIFWLLLRKAKFGFKYAVGVLIGVASLAVLLLRNIEILVGNGWKLDPETIPFQICHFGNIMVFIALVFRSKIAGSISWTLNMICAFLSLPFADSLPHYNNIWDIRPQCYIWGHLLIVLGAMYAIIMKIVRIDLKSFFIGMGVVVAIMIPAIIMNSYFNDVMGFNINYFYLYDSHGMPLTFLEGIMPRAHYGWFTIDWIYTLSVIAIALPVITGFYFVQKIFYIKDKSYFSENIILWAMRVKKEKALKSCDLKAPLPVAIEEKEETVEVKKEHLKCLKPVKVIYRKKSNE